MAWESCISPTHMTKDLRGLPTSVYTCTQVTSWKIGLFHCNIIHSVSLL